jgi:serine/threonine protein kinase
MSQGAAKERLRPFKPQRFGRYTLLRPLSTGGMGEIFLARLEGAQGFEKLCVIKKILPHLAEDKDFVNRFVDEARILVKLSHGNIAQVLDMGLHEAAPYIALEFIDGKDLRRVVARAQERALQLPLSFILYVTTRLLDALAYAHRKRGDDGKELNLVHRDVSPQNILISYEGEVKVIDFGLAKSALSSTRTHPSIVLGKFLYMSPEQARHQTVDRRSDLYAVGLCLYELIAGKGPFDGVSPGELMATVANPKILPLSQAEPLCPPSLSEVVMKALAADPTQRFQTAEELRGRLLTILLEIDPSAGPETATRFMTEAFATEYQGERKLLADLSEQARALGDAPHVPEEETLDPSNRSITREVAAQMPPLTLDEVPQARVTAPEVKLRPRRRRLRSLRWCRTRPRRSRRSRFSRPARALRPPRRRCRPSPSAPCPASSCRTRR